MVETFAKVGGPLQAALGILTAASAPAAEAVGAGAGASGFNVLSGAVWAFLGWKGSEGALQSGSLGLGGVNLLVGLLGLLGIHNLAGVPMNVNIVGDVINVGIGILGLVTGFTARK